MIGLRFGALLCFGASFLPAQDLRDFERKVTQFTLANGMRFLVLERHQVPVVSFHTYVNAGSSQDPAGKTGMASLIARLAIEGTDTIGTRNWPAEKKALEDVEAAFEREDAERSKGSLANAGELALLHANVTSALSTAFGLQNPNEYQHAIDENGGRALDSHATPDSIELSYSLPSNRIELWFVLESQRLFHPIFRNFFTDRQILQGDAGNALDAKSPLRLRQSLAAAAFEDLPYRNPVLGLPGDLATISPADARSFFETFCVPGNTIMAIVGDVDPANAQRLAERYFGPIPAKPRPPAMRVQELPQLGPKTVAVWSDGPPQVLIGYKRPPEIHRDDAALDVIATILGDKRTGWLGTELIEEKRLAQSVTVVSDFPAARYVNLFLLTVNPANGHTVDENRKAIDQVVTRLQSKPIDAETLTRARNILRGRYLRLLASNQELASLLPRVYADYGDWRRLFMLGSDYTHLTSADIQRVATEYLTPVGRTVVYLTAPPQPGSGAADAGGAQ